MATAGARRLFIKNISDVIPAEVLLQGWVYRLRILGKTAFVILRDCTGEAQCVVASEVLREQDPLKNPAAGTAATSQVTASQLGKN